MCFCRMTRSLVTLQRTVTVSPWQAGLSQTAEQQCIGRFLLRSISSVCCVNQPLQQTAQTHGHLETLGVTRVRDHGLGVKTSAESDNAKFTWSTTLRCAAKVEKHC